MSYRAFSLPLCPGASTEGSHTVGSSYGQTTTGWIIGAAAQKRGVDLGDSTRAHLEAQEVLEGVLVLVDAAQVPGSANGYLLCPLFAVWRQENSIYTAVPTTTWHGDGYLPYLPMVGMEAIGLDELSVPSLRTVINNEKQKVDV